MKSKTASRAKQVFGDLVAGTVEDSLCYSPSPIKQPIKQQPRPQDVIAARPKELSNNCGGDNGYSPDLMKKPNRLVLSDASNRMEVLQASCGKERSVGKRKDTMQKTEDAISAAAKSVNKGLNAVRKAKENSENNRRIEIARIREKRRLEKDEIAAYNAEAERQKHEILEMKARISSQIRKEKAQRKRTEQEKRLESITLESHFKSDVYRSQKQLLSEREKARRRESSGKRAVIRENNRLGEEKMKLSRIEEDNTLYEERHESSVAKREAENNESRRRRDSFSFRTGDAIRIRRLHVELGSKRLQERHESYELKWTSEKDAEAYKKQCADDRRDSFAFRGEEARNQKHIMDGIKSDEQSQEHASYELKWTGEKDAEAYKKQCAEDRRDSLSHRGTEAVRHRAVMEELRVLSKDKEAESFVLKWAGEEDAKRYLSDMEEEKRKSLQSRNEEGVRHREIEEQQRVRDIEEQAENERLLAACKYLIYF